MPHAKISSLSSNDWMPIYSNFGMKLNIPSQIVVLALRDVPKVRMMNANRNIRRDRHVLRLKSMVRRRRSSRSSIVAMTNRSYEYVKLRHDVRLITQHSISPDISRLLYSRMWIWCKLQRSLRSYHLHRSSTRQLGHGAWCQPHRCRCRRGCMLHTYGPTLDSPKVYPR